jgi:glycosyltransferase involved in cell wall biosynthesis
MRCPTLSELPPPPSGKTGWPWTQASPQLPNQMPDGAEWPKISIVTPNYNYGRFIEETIRSVLLQGYPNLEYIVIDGGSTDDSVEIIKKYEPWLSYWVSEKDNGQTNAINKGVEKSSGEIFNWINSDDILDKIALQKVAQSWIEDQPHILLGDCTTIDLRNNNKVIIWRHQKWSKPIDFLPFHSNVINQPSTFLSLDLLSSVGKFREDLYYVMDWEFYLRATVKLRKSIKVKIIEENLSVAKIHPISKTGRDWEPVENEQYQVLQEYCGVLSGLDQYIFMYFFNKNITQNTVSDILNKNNNSTGILRLIALLMSRPIVIISRFYWGAIKKTLIASFRKNIEK